MASCPWRAAIAVFIPQLAAGVVSGDGCCAGLSAFEQQPLQGLAAVVDLQQQRAGRRIEAVVCTAKRLPQVRSQSRSGIGILRIGHASSGNIGQRSSILSATTLTA
jgi:hypothetical protein